MLQIITTSALFCLGALIVGSGLIFIGWVLGAVTGMFSRNETERVATAHHLDQLRSEIKQIHAYLGVTHYKPELPHLVKDKDKE